MYFNYLTRTKPASQLQYKSLSSQNACFNAEFPKSIQVCILGAETPLGRAASFLMKLNPLISSLKLHGDHDIHGLVADLEHIDTRCRAVGFEGNEETSKALRGADVVLMLSNQMLDEDTTVANRIIAEGKRVYDLANECVNFAPKSLIVVNVPPVSVTTPLVAEVFKDTYWYHPGRIVGSAAIAQVKANTILGRCQDLDPNNCFVPIVGGPDIDLAVPLFSKAKPIQLSDSLALGLFANFRGIRIDQFPKKISKENYVENCHWSEAFSLNTMINTISMGLCGHKEAFYNAFMRSNALSACQYLVTTLQFSRGGVVHNFGIPQLSKLELRMLEKATLKIKEREEMAKEYLDVLKEGNNLPPPFLMKELERNKLLLQDVVK